VFAVTERRRLSA